MERKTENSREPKTHWNRFETPPNAIETQVIHRRGQVGGFYQISFPYFELFCTIVIFPYKLL